MKIGVLFDMDGTLWDSTKEITESWNLVLKDYGIQVTQDTLQSLMGQTMDVFEEALMPGLDAETRKQAIAACFEMENRYLEENGATLYDGVQEMFESLSKKYPLFIVSNCQSGYIEAFLKYYGFDKYITDLECYGNTGKGKADNEALIVKRNHLDQGIYIGDIQGDYDATKEAGLTFIHAAYGFGTIKEKVVAVNSVLEIEQAVEQVVKEM